MLCPAAWERCRCHRGSWRARWCQQQEQDGGGTPASPASGPHPERASGHSPSRRQAARRWKHCRGIKIKQQPPSTFYTSFLYYFLMQLHLSAQTQRHDSVLCTRSMVTNKLEQPFKKKTLRVVFRRGWESCQVGDGDGVEGSSAASNHGVSSRVTRGGIFAGVEQLRASCGRASVTHCVCTLRVSRIWLRAASPQPFFSLCWCLLCVGWEQVARAEPGPSTRSVRGHGDFVPQHPGGQRAKLCAPFAAIRAVFSGQGEAAALLCVSAVGAPGALPAHSKPRLSGLGRGLC